MATGRATVGAELIAAAPETRREELTSASLEETKGRIAAYRNADPDLLEHVREHHGLLRKLSDVVDLRIAVELSDVRTER